MRPLLILAYCILSSLRVLAFHTWAHYLQLCIAFHSISFELKGYKIRIIMEANNTSKTSCMITQQTVLAFLVKFKNNHNISATETNCTIHCPFSQSSTTKGASPGNFPLRCKSIPFITRRLISCKKIISAGIVHTARNILKTKGLIYAHKANLSMGGPSNSTPARWAFHVAG